jgi:hypothetical protein
VQEYDALQGFPRLEPVQDGRCYAEGWAVAENATLLTAPISGQPCLAFRIAGRAGDQLLDDAAATDFVVDVAGEPIELRASRWIISTPMPEPTKLALDDQQRERLAAFLRARGLSPKLGDTRLSETCVLPGDSIVAWGASETRQAQSQGYRNPGSRRALCDTDSKPLVVQRRQVRALEVREALPLSCQPTCGSGWSS